jgi:hypothetical protein
MLPDEHRTALISMWIHSAKCYREWAVLHFTSHDDILEWHSNNWDIPIRVDWIQGFGVDLRKLFAISKSQHQTPDGPYKEKVRDASSQETSTYSDVISVTETSSWLCNRLKTSRWFVNMWRRKSNGFEQLPRSKHEKHREFLLNYEIFG